MINEIDFREAPEGATHYFAFRDGTNDFYKFNDVWMFFNIEDDEWHETNKGDCWCATNLNQIPLEKTEAAAGMKHDQEKPMYNLLPANAIDDMAKVMTFGASKYAPNSWQNVDNPLERYRAALLRHTFAIQRGELVDQESGLPHSAHIMCCAAFINELER